MKLGANSVLFGGYDMETAFRCIAMAGYDGIEVSAIGGMSEHLVIDRWKECAPEIKRLAGQYELELLAMEHYDVIYSGADLTRAKRKQLEGIIKLFPWAATIDAFQHWIYTHPGHSREERKSTWLELQERFGAGVDYTGYDEAESYLWQQQLHLYEVPFYYIEYAIAQLGALQIWRNARRDKGSAIRNYRAALALGGSRPLPELFETAGAKLDFSYETMAPLIEAVQEELDQLKD